MQENNFEKQVQQKTDELRLSPSEGVWQKVAVAITKRRSGRRSLIIFFLLLVIICSSVFIIFNRGGDGKTNNPVSTNSTDKANKTDAHTSDSDTRQVIAASASPAANNSKPVINKLTDKSKHLPLINERYRQPQTSHNHFRTKMRSSVAMSKSASNSSGTVADNDVQPSMFKNKSKADHKIRQRLKTSITNSTPVKSDGEKQASSDISKIESGRPPIAPDDMVIKERVPDTLNINQTNLPQPLSKGPAQLANNSKQTQPGKALARREKKNKWKIGVKASVGIAATQNGYFGIINSGNGDAYKSAGLDAVTSPNNNGGQGPQTVYYPSKIKAGTGMILGLFAGKNISSRMSFTLGLNYKQYNSSRMTGNRVDSISNLSTFNLYYRNGSAYKYKNHFHFLELPVAVKFKMGRQNKLPLYLDLGLSISRLLSSNALQFDTLSGTYYRDNAVFYKTLVNVSGGLLFTLAAKAKNPLLIGPDINFSLNKIANSGLFKSRHYSYFGIQVQKTFGKQ